MLSDPLGCWEKKQLQKMHDTPEAIEQPVGSFLSTTMGICNICTKKTRERADRHHRSGDCVEVAL